MPTAIDAKRRETWEARLTTGVQHAWVRRNGVDAPAPFDTGMEFMEIDDDIEVYPMWARRRDDGTISSWSNHPPLRPDVAVEGAWMWRDTNPPPIAWLETHEDEEWMGTPEWPDIEDADYARYVSWIINAPHDQPPPVPAELLDYLVAAEAEKWGAMSD